MTSHSPLTGAGNRDRIHLKRKGTTGWKRPSGGHFRALVYFCNCLRLHRSSTRPAPAVASRVHIQQHTQTKGSSMSIKLYELTGDDDDRQFSPYCWRIRMALAHKGLAMTTVPWCFTEGDALKFAGATTVPVLVDGDKTLKDSWDIALYLDEAYPDRPKLFDSKQSVALALFFKQWAERSIPVMPVVLVLKLPLPMTTKRLVCASTPRPLPLSVGSNSSSSSSAPQQQQ